MKDVTSFFHNGAARGDADEAPYTQTLFNEILNTIYSSENGDGYVIPLYRDNLEVTPGLNRTVDVDDGAAYIKGIFYLSIATENLDITANNSEDPRWDRVVVRVNFNDNVQTARLAVIEGRPDCVPIPPALTQEEGSIWEISLARIYVPSGAIAINSYYIHDERVFAETALHENTYCVHNQFRNGEHLAWSGYLFTYPPDLWVETGTITFEAHDPFPQMSRGCNLYMEVNTGELITRTVLTKEYGDKAWFTLRFMIEVFEGECRIDFAGVQINVPPTHGPLEILIRTETRGYQTLTFRGTQDPDSFEIGQITLTQGLIGAPYKPKHEIILYNHVRNLFSSSFTINTYARDFHLYPGGYVRDIQSILVKLKTTSAGSAGVAGCATRLLSNSQNAIWMMAHVGNLPNNSIREVLGWIQADPQDYPDDYIYDYILDVVGATQTVTMDVIGIQT